MKTFHFFLVLAAMLNGCNYSSEPDAHNSDLNLSGAEIWEQVAVRYPASGDIVSVMPDSAVTLQIAGSDLWFGLNGNYCQGKINEDAINLGTCYSQSPTWIITEQTEDTMYIYPRLGAMYYYDLVMKKVQGTCSINCQLQPFSGPCEALISKYYFDKAEGKCKEFSWGGCQGVVPFETLEDCQQCGCNQIEGN
jgi:Kunitz/Bovine pancreatic trypsin inhibitor domain